MHFKKAVGVENLACLLQRGEKRLKRWEGYKDNFTNKIKKIDIDWVEDDFLRQEYWTEATFLLLHWTTFSTEARLKVAKTISGCVEGTQVIAFTTPVPGDDFDILIHDFCDTSWGKTEFFVQEKITPAKLINAEPTTDGELVDEDI